MPVHRNTTPPPPVTAVLGPTNTGKTHLAVERMLAHAGGMIGLPLRLLAREIYDRVRLKAGDHAVALITGEEKIIPAQPRYWVCTVEAMPPDLRVPFLAIDEVQLAGDFERGHIFTDRILNRRGLEETMLLGSASMRGILEKLIPGTTFIARPRFSKLSYAGPRKLSRLPRRSAIVAFTQDMVYAVAEMIRSQRGGAAVVMGSLSPRARNAQVALYQSGDVDYLVATDAIGMGLNMDVDHVAFASTRKFDGFHYRHLNPGELGQIAGRAGRYMNDGSFGVTGEAEAFEQDVIDRLENHNFESLRVLQWRNRDLDFRSMDQLRKSLGYLPNRDGLTRAQSTADLEALEAVCRDPSVHSLIRSPFEVERAWEVCQVPDYRNISPAEHAHIISRILTFLHSRKGVIDEDWFSKQLAYCENLEGNIDALSQRISHVRTWTFIANRADWLEAPTYWQGRAREIEDRLSDVLHEKLTQRFIDRRTSVLMRRLAKKEGLMSSVEEDGAIAVEGEVIGRIAGLSFVPGEALGGGETRLLKQAAVQALTTEVAARAISLSTTADTELRLTRQGDIVWQANAIGRLHGGDARFKPRVEVIADDILAPALREDVRQRLQKFVDRTITAQIEPLLKLQEAEGFEGTVRGLAYRIAENYGVLPRDDVSEEVKGLSQDDRAKLRTHGVRFGAHTVFLPALLKPAPTEVRMLLWWLEQMKAGQVSGQVPTLPPNGLTSMIADTTTPDGFYRLGGYRVSGKRAVRVDMLERLADMIRDRLFWKPRFSEEQRPAGSMEGGGFSIIPDMMSIVGCSGEDFQNILTSLGYRSQIRAVPKPVEASQVVHEPVESVPEAVAAETEPTIEATEIAVDAASGAPDKAVSEEMHLASETMEVAIWWPEGMGPFKQRPPRHDKQNQNKPHQNKPHEVRSRHQKPDQAKSEHPRGDKPHKRFDKSNRKPDRAFEKPSRPEKPMDPNSPFAALAALKASMGKGNG
jgi:ATP-dependent RNA helicase SUPV3L1/SUV3